MPAPRKTLAIVAAAIAIALIAFLAIAFSRMVHSPSARTINVSTSASVTNTANPGTPAWPALTFQDGTFFELLGIREYPEGKQWWGGDGSNVKEPQAPSMTTPATQPTREIRFRAKSIEDAYKRKFRFTIAGLSGIPSYTFSSSHIVLLGCAIVPAPADQATIDLKVGLPSAPPVELAHADIDFPAGQLRATTRPVLTPLTNKATNAPPSTMPAATGFESITYEPGHLKVTIKAPRTPEQRLLEATIKSTEVSLITRGGKPMRYTQLSWQGDNKQIYEFNISKEQIAAVALITRDIEWLTLPRLPLRPKNPATTTSSP